MKENANALEKQAEELETHKLRVQLLGFFDVSYKGKSIFTVTGGSIKSIAILRFLLAQKGKLFLAESMAESIWPDNEYLDEKKVIRTYIHRLRRIIAADNTFSMDFSDRLDIRNIKGCYALEIGKDVELDIDLLEKLGGEISEEKTTPGLMSLFGRLMDIYGGEFLEECRYDRWTFTLRNYYRRLFCANINGILSQLDENKDYPEIKEICEKSLKIYDLDESMNIYFMKALLETEQVTNALRHYNFITSKLYNELSVMPSEKMRAIYARIKSKKNTVPNISISETLDTNMLMSMINEAVKAQLAPGKIRFSLGYIKVMNDTPQGEPETEIDPSNVGMQNRLKIMDSLKHAIEFALRKNDMFVVTDEMSALFVLDDAIEEAFPIIANRISDSFTKHHKGYACRLKVKIFPGVNIL